MPNTRTPGRLQARWGPLSRRHHRRHHLARRSDATLSSSDSVDGFGQGVSDSE